ncbi:hypothetical protein HQ394_06625 [Defluviicoccus vanus]|uniref:Uncharacterized protein n=2 Tax=Defluviicoccus vanus TaxID=111831 RepID=A0A7H1N052_9PROT|nr:hypothetical protein HQ394_06625 [Defluviicoccus vanus]
MQTEARLKIAFQILSWATFGLGVIVAIMVIGASIISIRVADDGGKTFSTTVERIFTSLLPVVATWVGTVLAFYFTKESFQAASDSAKANFKEGSSTVTAAVAELGDRRLAAQPVSQCMRSYDDIAKIVKPVAELSKLNLVNDIEPLFKDKVTRLPLFDAQKVIKYMIHKSVLAFFFDHVQTVQQKTSAPGAAQVAGVSLTRENATLQDFLTYNDGKYGKVVETSFAFVAKDKTLADAVAAMRKVEKEAGIACQDVFVTATGEKSEPVLGWLSDRRIQNFAQFG